MKYAWGCRDLLNLAGVEGVTIEGDQTIYGMAMDSRHARKGDLFIALQGVQRHGLFYADQAIEKGVLAIACDAADQSIEKLKAQAGQLGTTPVYWVKNLRSKLGWLASCFFGKPSERISVTGITGTNGKSSCVHFIASMFDAMGIKCGVSGTLGVGVYPNVSETGMTTPDVVSVHRHLADLLEQGINQAVMEVSSHALDQGRVQGVQFDAVVFTNLTHEHLDYHQSMEAYFQAKKSLFSQEVSKLSILNEDNVYGQRLLQELHTSTLPFSLDDRFFSSHAGLRGRVLERSMQGCLFEFKYNGETYRLKTPVFSHFFVSNLLASIAVALHQGLPVQDVVQTVETIRPPKGRMECVAFSGPMVMIDYAHTPDALENILKELGSVCEGRLWCVFGCGGERDSRKRPMMAKAAINNADSVVVTSDNPRNENPEKIIAEIQKGLGDSGACTSIADREEAIRFAVQQAKKEDIVLVAGKGHEMYQIIAQDKHVPFDERAIIHAALEEQG